MPLLTLIKIHAAASLILLAFPALLPAQDVPREIRMDAQPSLPHQAAARESVSLMPGFGAKPLEGQSFHALIVKELPTALDGAASGQKIAAAYPNPTSGQLVLALDESLAAGLADPEFTLADMGGRVLMRGPIQGGQIQLDFSAYPPASYVLSLLAGGRSSQWTVLKR